MYKFKFFSSRGNIIALEQQLNDFFQQSEAVSLLDSKLQVDFRSSEPMFTVLVKYRESKTNPKAAPKFRFLLERSNVNELANRANSYVEEQHELNKDFTVFQFDHKTSWNTGSGTPVTVMMIIGFSKGFRQLKQEEAIESEQLVEQTVSEEQVKDSNLPSLSPVFFKSNNDLVTKLASGEASF